MQRTDSVNLEPLYVICRPPNTPKPSRIASQSLLNSTGGWESAPSLFSCYAYFFYIFSSSPCFLTLPLPLLLIFISFHFLLPFSNTYFLFLFFNFFSIRLRHSRSELVILNLYLPSHPIPIHFSSFFSFISLQSIIFLLNYSLILLPLIFCKFKEKGD